MHFVQVTSFSSALLMCRSYFGMMQKWPFCVQLLNPSYWQETNTPNPILTQLLGKSVHRFSSVHQKEVPKLHGQRKIYSLEFTRINQPNPFQLGNQTENPATNQDSWQIVEEVDDDSVTRIFRLVCVHRFQEDTNKAEIVKANRRSSG